MAFATKYRYTYYDINGAQVQVDLQLDGYAGSVNTRTKVAEDPVSVRWECTDMDDKFCSIFKSSCVAKFVVSNSGESLRELITASEKQYRLVVTVSGGTYFKGYVLPGYYTESFTDTYPLVIEVLATDGLAYLENAKYLNASGVRETGEKSYLTIIQSLLNSVNEASMLRFYNNLIENSQTDSSSTSMLEQTYIDVEVFYDDETSEPWNKLDVLDAILQTMGCRIFMTGGEWSIVRISEYTTSSLPYVKFTSAGAYSSNGTTTLKSTITSATASVSTRIVPINGNGIVQAMMCPRNVIARHHNSLKTNLVTYGYFTDWTDANTPLGWTITGLTTAPDKLQAPENGFVCSIPAQTAGDEMFTSMSKNDVKELLTYGGKLTFRYRNDGGSAITFSIRVYLQYLTGYYLDNAGLWGTTPTSISFSSIAASEDFTEYTLIVTPAPAYEFLKISIFPQTSGGPLLVDEIKLEEVWTTDRPKPADYDDYTEAIDANNRNDDEIIDMYMADYDLALTAGSLASTRGWLRDSTGNSETNNWGPKGGTKNKLIQEVLVADMLEQYENPYFRLSCDFEGLYSASKLLVDSSDSNKCYMPMRLELNVYSREWTGEWLEII